jgi:hypothetical protein
MKQLPKMIFLDSVIFIQKISVANRLRLTWKSAKLVAKKNQFIQFRLEVRCS